MGLTIFAVWKPQIAGKARNVYEEAPNRPPLEGSGFELPVPRCALIANSAALVAPPDSAVSGGSLNGRLRTPIGGGPATARLTRREDRSAQLGRGPENLGNRAAANYRFLNGSAASAVCPDRSREIRHPAVRRKRKARHALSTKPVPDPLSRGTLVGEVPGHDRKWSSASW